MTQDGEPTSTSADREVYWEVYAERVFALINEGPGVPSARIGGDTPGESLARGPSGGHAASRWIAPLAIVTLLLTVSCTQQAGAGDAGDMVGLYPAVPFGAFLASVASASYRQYAGRPGARVRDQQAFDEMRSYLLARYHGARAVRSYTAADIDR